MKIIEPRKHRSWNGLKVVDAKTHMRVFLLPEDIDGAERLAPDNCAFVRAVRRSCGTEKAIFFRSIAYVELMQPNGPNRIERFMMPVNMRSVIEAFDKTGTCPPGGFTLSPPSYTNTFEGKAKRFKALREAHIKGTVRKQRPPAKPIEVLSTGVQTVDGVRYGSGMVQFKRKEPFKKEITAGPIITPF